MQEHRNRHQISQELTNIDKWDLLNVGDESEGNCQVLCLLDGDGWPSIIPAEGNITVGVNRPALGGTVPNLTAMSRCPALLTFYPAF